MIEVYDSFNKSAVLLQLCVKSFNRCVTHLSISHVQRCIFGPRKVAVFGQTNGRGDARHIMIHDFRKY